MKLRSHLLARVGVTLIPLVCFAVIIVLLLHGEQRKALERGLLDTSRALAVAIDREVERSIAVLEALATSEHLDSGDLKKCYAQAQRVRQSQKDWQSVALIGPSGQQLLNLAAPFGARLPDLGDLEVLRQVIRTGRPQVSDLIRSPGSPGWVIAVDVPVFRGGKLRGVLNATVRPDAFASIMAQQRIPGDGVGTIIDRKGIIVARTRGGDDVA